MNREIYMEDIHDIGIEALTLIQKRLEEFGIKLEPEEEDLFYVPIENTLEKISKYPDYRNYN